jgi:sodium-dependent dicarboxylate transporter 2/3/5
MKTTRTPNTDVAVDLEEERQRQGYSLRQKLGLVSGILLFVLALWLPTPSELNLSAQRAGAVAVLMAAWWLTEALPLYATALLPLVLYPLLGIAEVKQAAAPYAEPTVFLFMGGFFLAMAMQRWSLHRRIALVVVRILGNSPRRLILGFMVATALISMWVSNTATAMMLFPIGLALVHRFEPESLRISPDSKPGFGAALMLGIAYAASIGGVGTLIGTPPNAIFVGQAKQLFPNLEQIDFLKWMLIGLPYVLLFLPLAWFYLTFIFMKNTKISRSAIDAREELSHLGPLSRGEMGVMTIFFLTVFAWVFRSDLHIGVFVIPGWSNLLGVNHWIDDSTVAILASLLLFAIPVDLKKGIFLLNWEWAKKIPWGVLILFGGGFALADSFQKTGLATWLGNQLQGLNGIPLPVLIIAICLIVTFLSELTSNTALAAMMMPILGATATAMGIHPYLLMIPATIAASSGFILPVATPPNAIVFGSGYLKLSQMARAGFLLDLLGALLATMVIYLIAIPLLKLM